MLTVVHDKERALMERLHDLTEARSCAGRKIERKKGRLAGARARGESASFFVRLRKLIDQVAFFTEKERHIIGEIDHIERKHHEMRRHKLLKRVEPKTKKRYHGHNIHDISHYRYHKHSRREDHSLWWILGFFYLISRPAKAASRKTSPKAG